MARPRLTPDGYWGGPALDREAGDVRRLEYDTIGSQMLRDRMAEQIILYARVEKVSIEQAMNELLYAGELR